MTDVRAPDGSIVRFPDGTDVNTIKSVMRRKFGMPNLSERQRDEMAARTAQLNRRTETEVAESAAIPGTGQALNFLQGLPFAGEYTDEAAALGATGIDRLMGGARRYEDFLSNARDVREGYASRRPASATALQVGGGITGAAMLAPTIPAIAAQAPASLGGQVAMGAGLGTIAGALEGGISGYGAGEGGVAQRLASAGRRAAVGGALGGAIGAATPLVAAGARGIADRVAQYRADRTATAAGLSPQASRNLAETMRGMDDQAMQARVRAAGPNAMLTDAGEPLDAVLDTAIQKTGGRYGRQAVEQRAADTQHILTGALDRSLGRPQGMNQIARGISQSTAPGRSNAYGAAYGAAINYADDAGRQIESVLGRIPPRIMREAINTANESMIANGQRNMQILADIADDGTVAFREMPNVQQLDQIKQALDSLAETDVFGRVTKAGLMPQRLARELRDAVSEAVPEYRAALAAGADKIAQDRGLVLGANLLRSNVTRENVRDAVATASEAELEAMRRGLRSYIDDAMAEVKRTITNPNVDSREAMKVVKDMSSRANRQKVSMILPNADDLFEQLDQAARALELQARTVSNSLTYARTATDQRISDMTEGGIVRAAARGEPVHAGKRLVQALTGQTRMAEAQQQQALYDELARALTESRGQEAQRQLAALLRLRDQQPIDELTAALIGRRVATGAGIPAYLAGKQSQSR